MMSANVFSTRRNEYTEITSATRMITVDRPSVCQLKGEPNRAERYDSIMADMGLRERSQRHFSGTTLDGTMTEDAKSQT